MNITNDKKMRKMLRLFDEAEDLEQLSFSFPVSSDADDWKRLEEAAFDQTFINQYNSINGAKFTWRSKKDSSISGSCRFLKAKEIVTQQKGVLVFNDTDSEAWQHDFFPVDFFADEACAGVFAGKQASNCMYLYLMDDEYPLNLKSDVQTYFDLMISCFAFEYWQMVLDAINKGKENASAQIFKTQMPLHFKNFNYKDFANQYQSMKIQ